ncbi:MAG TPA: glycosyltransferase [Pirellulales bacterium]
MMTSPFMVEEPPMHRHGLIINSLARGAEASEMLGATGYSYEFVLRAFEPLLRRWGEVRRVERPESQVDFAARQMRRGGLAPVHLSFRPFSDVYLTRAAPNVIFPFWEFPDVPASDYKQNPRNHWVRIANRASLVLTASHFTAAALRRAGMRTAVRIVPVPVADDYFRLPNWNGSEAITLDCPAYVFTRPEVPPILLDDPEDRPGPDSTPFRVKHWLRSLARRVWVDGIKPLLPLRLTKAIVAGKNAAKRAWREGEIELPTPDDRLTLSGVVYTTILNPDDHRKNWQDLLTAFLLAVGDRADATLVIKLVTSSAAPVREVLGFYYKCGLAHRARVAFVTSYLSEEQMRELARASTYYLNASRAEGACLPLQDFLAAGRPGIAPAHTALADYFDDQMGFVVASQAEPCAWPDDESGRLNTSWHRIDWTSLREQIAAAYEVALNQPHAYQQLASAARQRMHAWASADAVWPKLKEALALVAERADGGVAASAGNGFREAA